MFGALGDPNPTPDIVRPILGPGAARSTHNYFNLTSLPGDSASGVASNNPKWVTICLLYTSDAADERSSVDLGGRRIIKKKKT